MAGRTSITLAEGMTGMTENVFLNIKNKSKTITAEVEVPEGKVANGIVIAQGGRFRRLGAVRQGRHSGLRLQLPWPAALHRGCDGEAETRQVDTSVSTSPMTAAVWARAAWAPST